ncbi:hypothetical protein BGZ83_004162 [Gryganskiella cystojenkinii]|nr:hypothetical protein BGZ83_004162 [Gryganskiella cystojenkinii]
MTTIRMEVETFYLTTCRLRKPGLTRLASLFQLLHPDNRRPTIRYGQVENVEELEKLYTTQVEQDHHPVALDPETILDLPSASPVTSLVNMRPRPRLQPRLEGLWLDLRIAKFQSKMDVVVAILDLVPKLTHFGYNHDCPLSRDWCHLFDQGLNYGTLEELDFSGNTIETDDGVRTIPLEEIPVNSNLKILRLNRGSGIGPRGLSSETLKERQRILCGRAIHSAKSTFDVSIA